MVEEAAVVAAGTASVAVHAAVASCCGGLASSGHSASWLPSPSSSAVAVLPAPFAWGQLRGACWGGSQLRSAGDGGHSRLQPPQMTAAQHPGREGYHQGEGRHQGRGNHLGPSLLFFDAVMPSCADGTYHELKALPL